MASSAGLEAFTAEATADFAGRVTRAVAARRETWDNRGTVMIEGRFTKTRERREVEGQARYLTFSCQGRLPLFQNNAIKEAFVNHLVRTRERTHFRLFAWVIMPEHVHLLLMPNLPQFPIPIVLRHLKGGFANIVLRRWRELNAPILDRLADSSGKPRFWLQGGGYDRNTFVGGELVEKAWYIHKNPVVRELVKNPLDYPWSSARWYSDRKDEALITMDPLWNREGGVRSDDKRVL